MRASLIQLNVGDTETPAARQRRALELARQAPQSDVLVMPELWIPGAFDLDQWDDLAAPVPGDVTAEWSELAKQRRCVVHAGSYVERAADGSHYNTSVVFDANGEVAATYRKIHRFGFDRDSGEAAKIDAGNAAVTFPAEFSQTPATVGIATCFDLRFPELYRLLADNKPEMMITVAGWPASRRSVWRALNVARAMENQTYVLACNCVGTHADTPMGGHSMIIDPNGEIIAEAGEDEQILTAEFDLGTVNEMRKKFAILDARRITVDSDIPASN